MFDTYKKLTVKSINAEGLDVMVFYETANLVLKAYEKLLRTED